MELPGYEWNGWTVPKPAFRAVRAPDLPVHFET